MREIWIRKKETMDIAVVEDGRLVEYLPVREEAAADVICLGRVERVVPGMQAAFVQIGQEKCGFLPLDERGADQLPKLQVGQHIIVQIRKEAQGVKGAYLTRDVSLCGEYVLLTPMSHRIGVSSRITNEADRKALKSLGSEIAAGRFGLVMRSACLGAEVETIRAEAEVLLERWQEVCRSAPTAHAPSVLYARRTMLDSVLEDYAPKGIERIVTNDPKLETRLQKIAPVLLLGDNLFDVGRISNQLARALERRVWLESGGNLIFDPCEAMTVIDVNSAKFTGQKQLEETVLQLNIEACAEIARQVRLRNCSGIIIIDMVDMASGENRTKVLQELKRCFADDRVKTVVHGFTALGLVEMTRKRTRAPLREALKKENQNG